MDYCPVLVAALSVEHLEVEFLVVGGVSTSATLQPLRDKGHHVELLQRHKHFSQTVASAFERAHFSLLLVSLHGQRLSGRARNSCGFPVVAPPYFHSGSGGPPGVCGEGGTWLGGPPGQGISRHEPGTVQ